MCDFSFDPSTKSQQNTRTPSARVSSEGSPKAEPREVMEGRSETCRVERARRMSFEEALGKVYRQVGYSTLYCPPVDPRFVMEYRDRMALAQSLCMTVAEVYAKRDDWVFRIEGEEIEASTVKAVFWKLSGDHIVKVVNSIRADRRPTSVKYKRSYLRAALYNAVFEWPAQMQAGIDSLML